jgi:predicted acetyltransferase
MHLERASQNPPPGLAELLTDLGDGESGFSGTAFGRGECSLDDFLRMCVQSDDPAFELPPGFVPQTMYWMIAGDDRRAVGIVRVRHFLNERLQQAGGHIGYYVHPAHRRNGYATRALGFALDRLRELGVTRALLTVDPANTASARVILAHGGVANGQGIDPDRGHPLVHYWIDLSLA